MKITDRLFPLSIMASILIFTIIHLGVAIGVIVPFRQYGDIFSPEVGLAGYNLVVTFFGLVTAVLGIISAFVNSKPFATAVCFVAGFLGILALASLITAIVINAKSPDYVKNHFTANRLLYPYSEDARTKIDGLQTKYKCCGTHLWVDWAEVGLNGTVTTTTTRATMISGTTSEASRITANPTTGGNPTIPDITTGGTTPSSRDKQVKRDLADISKNDLHQRSLKSASYSRKKRDDDDAEVYDLDGLPLSVNVVLPGSCCTSDAVFTDNVTRAYCWSTLNSTTINHFYHEGCSRPIDLNAGNIATGFSVINSFMVVFAFIAIPVMLQKPSVPV